MTYKELLKKFGSHELLEDAARDIAYKYLKLKGGWNAKPKSSAYVLELWFNDDDEFTFEWEGGCGCCPPDTFGEETIPNYAINDFEMFAFFAKIRGDFNHET